MNLILFCSTVSIFYFKRSSICALKGNVLATQVSISRTKDDVARPNASDIESKSAHPRNEYRGKAKCSALGEHHGEQKCSRHASMVESKTAHPRLA